MVNDHHLHPGLDSRDTQFRRNLYPTDTCGQEERTDKEFKLRPVLMTFGWNMVEYVKNISTRSKTTMGYKKTQDEGCTPIESLFFTLLRMIRTLTPSSRMQEENWTRSWNPPCRVRTKKRRKEDINNSMSTQPGEPCAEAQLGETSCTKEEQTNTD